MKLKEKSKIIFFDLKNFLRNENFLEEEKMIFFDFEKIKNDDFLKEIEDPKNLLIFLKVEQFKTKKMIKNRSTSIRLKKKKKFFNKKNKIFNKSKFI